MGVGHKQIAPILPLSLALAAIELVVALAQQQKGIVIATEPDVKSVLFDATSDAAAGRTLAAKSPTELVNSNVVGTFVARLGQLECRSNRRAATADDGDFDGLANCQLVVASLLVS